MGVRMIEVIYSKIYSLIYDIIGLGRLIHNDKDFIELLALNPIEYNNDIEYYKSLIDMVDNPNEDVSSMFYLYKENTVLKVIFEDIQINNIISTIECIQDFYDILSEPNYLLSFVNEVYFSELKLDPNALLTKSELYTEFLVMPISKEVENSLYLFFEDTNEFCNLLIEELKKYGKIINKIYNINKSDVNNIVSSFQGGKIEKYNKYFNSNIKDFKTIIIAVSYTNLYFIFINVKEKFILYLGKKSLNIINQDLYQVIDITKFNQIISDEIRLKILELLKKQKMYGKEIADKLNIKRNIAMYHIDILVKENILKFNVGEKNIYYEINYDYFQNIYEYIKDYIKEE